jgi:hypothetical protein
MLASAQKADLREVARSMLQTLKSHAASNFHFLWTGDNLSRFHQEHHEMVFAASWGEVNELECVAHYHRMMVTAFFNSTMEYFMNTSLRRQSMDTSSFVGEMINGLEDVCDPEGRNPHERKIALCFHNAFINKNGHGSIGVVKSQWSVRYTLSSGFAPV